MGTVARLSAVLLLAALGCAEDGGALLERIAAARAGVSSLSGTATRTVVRTDPEEREGDRPRVWQVAYHLVLPAKYHIQLSRAGDTTGEFTRYQSDGVRHWELTRFETGSPIDARELQGDAGTWQRIAACIRADLPALRPEFAIAATSAEGLSTVELTPLPGSGASNEFIAIRVQFDLALRPLGLVMVMRRGDTETIAITTLDERAQPDPSLFLWPATR